MDPPVFQVAIEWWLGLDVSEGSPCALCPGSTLDHLGHHAVTCKYGGDVVTRHNMIRDILVETCHQAHIGVKVEVGNNLSRDHSKTRPADILLPNWFLGRTAALDVSITSPLNPVILLEAGVLATAAAQATESRKHHANDPKCSDLGWPPRLATSMCWPKSIVLNEIYGQLNLYLLVRMREAESTVCTVVTLGNMVTAETPCSTTTSCPKLNRHQPPSRLRAPISSQLSQQLFISNPQQLPHPRHRIPRRNESHDDFSTTHSQPEEQQSSPTHLSLSTTSSRSREVYFLGTCLTFGWRRMIFPSATYAINWFPTIGCPPTQGNVLVVLVVSPVLDSVLGDVPHNLAEMSLPTFEDVCLLDQPTLRFIPSKSRPAFARALSSILRSVILENTEEAWLKLFMLPRCVLPSLRRKGRHDKPLPVDSLCNMWSDDKLGALWSLAKSRSANRNHPGGVSINNRTKVIDQAVSLGRSGMFGKACRVLQSSVIAPNNETWHLLKSKHPSCPTPVAPASHSALLTLEPDFNILSVLCFLPQGHCSWSFWSRVQHLLDVASVPLPTSICSSLRQLVNILAAGKVPTSVSKFLAGGCLIALNKNKEGCPTDIRPIAVGETIRRLTGKCMCALVKDKATEFFQPLQLGVACRAGAEKVVHALRGCIEEHWMDEDFVVLKVDMRNAFNIVSRQAVLDECATLIPELLPWVSWCYGTHPLRWHPLGQISSESGVQQGDPLGPLLFALVLQKLVSSLDADEECAEILLQAWYLDDGALAGTRSAVLRALHVIEELGPALGLHVNLAKCEMFSRQGNTSFPPKFIAGRCAESRKLLSGLVDVAAVDLQVKQCFVMCSAINVTNDAWSQAQLGLKFGGLGLRSLSHHAAAAFIASLSFSGFGKADNIHLKQAVAMFNTQVSPFNAITVNSALESPIHQKVLSGLIQTQHFHILLESSSPANRARLLSVAAPHASSWLSVVPSPGLGLHLESNEFQMAIRWWLGLDTSGRSMCPFCPDTALDPLGHHAVTCRHGGDVVTRAIIVYEMRDLAHTRPADILIAGWDRGKPAALDLTITSPLCSVILVETYGNLGKQAHDTFSRLASFLAIHQSSPKAVVVAEIYGRLNVVLVWSIARAILARELPPS
eukprot:Em0014g587a